MSWIDERLKVLNKAFKHAENLKCAITCLTNAIDERYIFTQKMPRLTSPAGTTAARRAKADLEILQCNLLDYRARVIDELKHVELYVGNALAELDVEPLLDASPE
jgi:hypothetical protein